MTTTTRNLAGTILAILLTATAGVAATTALADTGTAHHSTTITSLHPDNPKCGRGC